MGRGSVEINEIKNSKKTKTNVFLASYLRHSPRCDRLALLSVYDALDDIWNCISTHPDGLKLMQSLQLERLRLGFPCSVFIVDHGLPNFYYDTRDAKMNLVYCTTGDEHLDSLRISVIWQLAEKVSDIWASTKMSALQKRWPQRAELCRYMVMMLSSLATYGAEYCSQKGLY